MFSFFAALSVIGVGLGLMAWGIVSELKFALQYREKSGRWPPR